MTLSIFHPDSEFLSRRMVTWCLVLCLIFAPFGSSLVQPMAMDSPCDQCNQMLFSGHHQAVCNQLDCNTPFCLSLSPALNVSASTILLGRIELAADKLWLPGRSHYQSPFSARSIRPPID